NIPYIRRRPPMSTTPFPYTTLFRSEVDVAVEPAGQRGAEEADDGKREEVKRTEAGEERSTAKQRSDTEGDEDDAENNPYTGIELDRKSTRLNSSHLGISYADFCLKK